MCLGNECFALFAVMCLGNECFALPTLDEFLLDQVEIFIKFGFVLHACMHFFYHLLATTTSMERTNLR